jgi:hypothetical protein
VRQLRAWDQKLEVSDWEGDAAAKASPKAAAAAAKH